MIDFQLLNCPALLRHYMLANTPVYLYRHLRAEPSVESLAGSATPEELLAAVSAFETQPNRSAEGAAVAYAMLVALSFQNYRTVQQALAKWRPRTLRWATHIIAIIGQTAIATNVVRVKAPSGHVAAVSQQNRTPTTVVEIP